jgi:hypothetical protein
MVSGFKQRCEMVTRGEAVAHIGEEKVKNKSEGQS